MCNPCNSQHTHWIDVYDDVRNHPRFREVERMLKESGGNLSLRNIRAAIESEPDATT